MKKILITFLLTFAIVYLAGCSGKKYTITYKFNDEIVFQQNVSSNEEFAFPTLSDYANVSTKEYFRWYDGEELYLATSKKTLKSIGHKSDTEFEAVYRYQDSTELNEYTFESDNTATFKSYNLEDTKYEIPNKVLYNDEIYDVKSIASGAFRYNTTIERISIGNGILNIYSYAFASCSNLKYVEIPNTVNYVETYLFWFTTVSVFTSIKEEPSSWTATWKQDATLYWDVEKGIDYETINGATYLIENNTASIIAAENLDGFVIPNKVEINNNEYSVTKIGSYAFAKNINLLSIDIPTTITTIGSYAFHSCINLSIFTIPNTVDTIGISAFYNCNNLIIYTSLESAKANWDSNWSSGAYVEWNVSNDSYDTINNVTYLITNKTNKEVTVSKVENVDDVVCVFMCVSLLQDAR